MSSESEALTEIRALTAGIIKLHADRFGTHSEACFVFHVACLAVRVADICGRVES